MRRHDDASAASHPAASTPAPLILAFVTVTYASLSEHSRSERILDTLSKRFVQGYVPRAPISNQRNLIPFNSDLERGAI